MALSHYCSNEAFVSIISNRELWISELSLSNDFLEGKWIRTIFSELCATQKVTTKNSNQLLEHLDALIAIAGGAGFCLSEEPDQLSQWRGYANNGTGMSLGLNRLYLQEVCTTHSNEDFGLQLTKMIYDVEEQKRLVSEPFSEVLKCVEDGALIYPTLLSTEDDNKKYDKARSSLVLAFMLFLPHMYSLKNPAFEEEKEWRLLSHVIRGEKDGGQISKMDFRASSDSILPFWRLPFQTLTHPTIEQVVIGPRNPTPIEVVQALLTKSGFEGVTVCKSRASYR